jgi:NADH:ubiquinone oxidoreductase subunit 4 (subunit M)
LIEILDSYVLLALVAWPMAAAGGIFLLRRGRGPALAAGAMELVLACYAWIRLGVGIDLFRPIDWVRAEAGVDLALRIDPLGGLGVLVLAGVALVVLALPMPQSAGGRRGYYELLLGLLGVLMGLQLAADLGLVLAMLPAVLIVEIGLNGRFSRSSRVGRDMRRFIALYAAWLVVVVALFRWAWLHYEQAGLLSFAYDDLLTYMPAVAEADGLWTMLFAGFVCLFGLSGAFWILQPIGRRLPLGGRLLVVDAVRWTGLCLVARVLLPIWPRAGEASASPYLVLLVASAAGLVLAGISAVRRQFRHLAPAGLVLWNSGICLLLLLHEPWSVALGLAMGVAELATKMFVLSAASLQPAQRKQLACWAVLAAAAVAGAFASVAGWQMVCSGCEALVAASRASHEIPGRAAFNHRIQATTGLLSMLGVLCWAMGVLSIRPFASGSGRASREVVIWRLSGPALIQLGLGLYLLDGVWWRMPQDVEPYMTASFLLHPVRAATFIAVHLGLVLSILAAAVGYLRLADWRLRRLDDLSGLHRAHPGVAAAIAIAALSLFAAPLTAGFWSTMTMFGMRTAWHSRSLLGLPLLFVLPISAFAAVEQIQCVYSAPSNPRPTYVPAGWKGQAYRILIALLAAAIVLLGILPQLLATPLRAVIGR